MNLLIVADIFGRTKALDDFAEYLDEKQINIEILDPYNKRYRNFENEDDAYKSFQKEIGLDSYTNLLKQKVNGIEPTKKVLLGFSVGASAIWAASPYIQEELYKGICFYSSQIRNYLEIEPRIDIELYFAKSESSYEVDKVATHLKSKKKVKCFKTNYMHGFMNERSENFNEEGHAKYREIIKFCITSHLRRTR